MARHVIFWLVVPQGNGKTTLLAALGLYGLRFAHVCELTFEHFVAWCGEKLVLDSGEAVRFEEFQTAFLRDVFAGYRRVAVDGEGASIPIAASTRDQVRIMYRQMKGFVTRSELWRPDDDGLWFECFDGYRQIQLRKPGKTKRGEVIGQIEVHAADAGSADGVIPYPFGFLDELHRHKDLALHRTWVGKLDKRGANLVVISTAGEPGHEFESTREKIRTVANGVETAGAFGRYETERIVMHDWRVASDAILDIAAVKAANPLSSITAEILAARHDDPTMTENHWRRFTCNLATMDEGREPYIDLQDWDGLADTAMVVPAGASVCLGADGSRSWDTTVIAWASADKNGFVKVDARVFSVRTAIACHVLHSGGRIDFDDVEAFIIDRFDQFGVAGAAYDPRYLERSMDIVEHRLPFGSAQPVEPASKNMRDALQCMFNLVAEGKLKHSGDEVLRQHVANSRVERGFGSEIRRVQKVDLRLPIDAVPAMALAVWSVEHGAAADPPMFVSLSA